MRKFMQAAIQSARTGMREGKGGPFGACLIQGGKVLAVAHNTVLSSQDPTCHAEVNVIRLASLKIKSFDLSSCVIYSTTEPCPMCFSAIHWAKIKKIIYGTSIADVQMRGFNELALSAREMKRLGKSPVKVAPVIMRRECLKLLVEWDQLTHKQLY